MLHELKYSFLSTVREKSAVFWLMLFPLLLSTMFYFAFSNLFASMNGFSQIPVAVVEVQKNEIFGKVMDTLSEGEDAMFKTTYTDGENAMKLLEEGEIDGIIYTDGTLSLKVKTNGLSQSIIESFLTQYNTQEAVIKETVQNNPQKLEAVIAAFSKEIDAVETKPLTNGTMDIFVGFFHALIGMVALMGSTLGFNVSANNQANLSQMGVRKAVSPTSKLKRVIGSMLSTFIIHCVCVAVTITYMLLVLRIDMGDKIPMIYLSGFIGALTGVSIGYFIGALPRISLNGKLGICIGFTLVTSFFSGLYVADIKGILSVYAPIVNEINPATLITDLFYCLMLYDDYTRYMQKFITLLIISVIFTLAGVLLTRRKKYASL